MAMERRVRDASVHAPAPLLAQALLDLFERYNRVRNAAGEYLSVPSDPGDWIAEEQAARQKLSEALNA
jgi:hypothetical protein